MKRCLAYRMMMLLLLLTGWQGHVWSQPLDKGGREAMTLGTTRDDRPQWQDLGMENVLVVSQPTVEVPTTLRLSSGSATPLVRRADEVHRYFRSLLLASASPHRAMPGYLYFLLCLRL